MALAILSGSVTAANIGAGPSQTITYVNSAACVMVMTVQTWSVGGYCPVTSVTDSSGVTWRRRRQTQFFSPNYNITTVDKMTQEIWWANVTATHASPVTVTINFANTATLEGTAAQAVIFGVTGSLVPATPWDTNGSASQSATYSNASTDTAPTVGYANSSSAAMILSFVQEMTSGAAPGGVGTGYTLIGQNVIGVSNRFGCGAEFKLASGAGSGSAAWAVTGGRAWATVSDALTSDSTGTASPIGTAANLTIHGTPVNTHDNSGTATTVSATITTTAPNCVLIAVVAPYHTGATGPPTVTGVTGAGLTWTKRASNTYPNPLSGTIRVGLEVWWAVATSPVTAQAIQATVSSAPNNRLDLMVFAVSDSPNPSAPWDANVSLPGYAQNAGSLNNPTRSTTISSTNAMMLGFVAYAWNANAANTAGSGFTDILPPTTDNSLRDHWEYKLVVASGTQTVNLTGNQQFWVLIGDALSGDASIATTGTITTSLTKPSQSLSGTEKFAGTIATNLTKASQTVAATQSTRGTISTALSKASFSATGFENLLGSITTNLTKASQSLVAKETFTGSISTHLNGVSISGTIASERFIGSIQSALSRISQDAAGNVSGGPHGTITTVLAGISQLAKSLVVTGTISMTLRPIQQALVAREIIVGDVVTNIDSNASFSIHALSFEVFTGSIVTRLSRANFALDAEERMIGQIVTRLGSLSGALVGNLIEGAVIIQGPIEMHLNGIDSQILGAKLGTPGEGKWYSYRYLDR